MRRSDKLVTGQQDNYHKTEEICQGGGQLLHKCRAQSTERLEDDPGLECRNRYETGCDTGTVWFGTQQTASEARL